MIKNLKLTGNIFINCLIITKIEYYFWCLILSQSEGTKPITLGLQTLQGQWMSSWNIVSAGSVVAALLPVIMFFTMQKHFIQGLTFVAVKG